MEEMNVGITRQRPLGLLRAGGVSPNIANL